MTTGTNFVRSFNPIWYFVDLVGKQADGSFYLWTLTNTIPYIPQAVYHDVNGLIPWTDPIQFQGNGTLPTDIYFDDTKVYRLEIRQNNGTAPPSQADALIYFIDNYIPNSGTGGGSVPSGAGIITNNQISNPQFSTMTSNQPITLAATNPAPLEVAPGWFLDLSGTGTVTVTQVPLNTTQSNPTNAPYALKIESTGWSNPPVLRQRFQQNGMNWQNKTVATSITARMDGAPQSIVVRMNASNGNPVGGVLINQLLTGAFTEYQGNTLVPTFANLNIPPDAYIDYKIFLPQTGVVYLTSIQVTESATNTNVEYQQDTIDRQLDHLAHYYKPQLQYKPIPSYLIGWDFAKNPAQILGETIGVQAIGANKSFYSWDQTIIFQTANSGVSVSRDAVGGGIKITAAQAGQFAVLQYLPASQVRDLLQGRMSVFVSGLTTGGAGYYANVSLWVNNTDASITAVANTAPGTNNSAITALGALGKPTMGNGTWTEIPRSNLGDTKILFAPPPDDFYLNGWTLNGASIADNAKWFAIVIGFEPIVMGDSVTINSVGLCAGNMATKPAPKTIVEAERDCEIFYEKSYKPTSLAGAFPETENALVAPMSSAIPNAGAGTQSCFVLETSFGFSYKSTKAAATPSVKLYSPVTGAIDNVRLYALGFGALNQREDAIALWGTTSFNDKYATFFVTSNSNQQYTAVNEQTPLATWINYHYVVDSRIGIVI